MADALMQSKYKSFWDEVRKCRPIISNLPNTVDGVQGGANIAGVFATKFEIYITVYLMTEIIWMDW